MERFFGAKKEAPPPPSLDEVTQRIDVRLQNLDAKIQSLDNQLMQYQKQLSMAKSPAAQKGIKEKAMRVLKQKKMYEGQRDQLVGSQMNMEQANFTIQSMKDTAVSLDALRSVGQTMKEQMKGFDIHDVYRVQNELEDAFDYQREIEEIMSRSYGVPEDLDEADLDAGTLDERKREYSH